MTLYLTIGKKLGVARGEWVAGCWPFRGTLDSNEHWVLNITDESLNSAPETNNILYVN